MIDFKVVLQHIIPEEIMKLVDEHTNLRTFGSMYVVADVQNCWQMATRQVSLNPDPILVGVDHINGKNVYYLVAKFDLTPAEEYIIDEFIG